MNMRVRVSGTSARLAERRAHRRAEPPHVDPEPDPPRREAVGSGLFRAFERGERRRAEVDHRRTPSRATRGVHRERQHRRVCNWELEIDALSHVLEQSRAVAVDMESATIATNGFRYRMRNATLLSCAPPVE